MVLQPDPDGNLSHGLVIEASLLARVLGAKLLRVQGTVTVTPATVDRFVTAADEYLPLRDASWQARPDGAPDRALGAGLEEARRLLGESRTTRQAQ